MRSSAYQNEEMFPTRAVLEEELFKIPPVVKQVWFPVNWERGGETINTKKPHKQNKHQTIKHCFDRNTNNDVYSDITNI